MIMMRGKYPVTDASNQESHADDSSNLANTRPELVAALRNLIAAGGSDEAIVRFMGVAQVSQAEIPAAREALSALRKQGDRT